MGNDGAKGMTKMSDRRAKEDIVAVGRHALGFGIYVYRYRTGFTDTCGTDRQIGCMADEVADLYPAAVVRGADGFLRVDYSRLFG